MLIIDLIAHIIKDFNGFVTKSVRQFNEFFTDSHRAAQHLKHGGISATPPSALACTSMGVKSESYDSQSTFSQWGFAPAHRTEAIKATVMVMIVRMEYMFFWVKFNQGYSAD